MEPLIVLVWLLISTRLHRPVELTWLIATFAGDSTYATSMGSNNLTVGLLPTSVVVSPVSGDNGDKVTLTATLTDTHNSVPVANELVNFTVNGVSCG